MPASQIRRYLSKYCPRLAVFIIDIQHQFTPFAQLTKPVRRGFGSPGAMVLQIDFDKPVAVLKAFIGDTLSVNAHSI